MEARNRDLPEWFARIESGQIRLPRFQRFEAWNHNDVAGLLEAVLHGLPTGVTLILEIGDNEPFKSRVLEGAPETTERVTEHLLDGQQRLTALWRSMKDNYKDRSYFAYHEQDDETGSSQIRVEGIARWEKNGKRYPVWADNPRDIYERGYIPIRLMRPGDIGAELREWCQESTQDLALGFDLERHILELRSNITTYNIPFLSLPSATPRHVALGVFIKMNTSSVRLTEFDIVVAQVEDEVGSSLHELMDSLNQRVPSLKSFVDPRNLILNVASLREGRTPTQASYQKLDFKKLASEWESLCIGIAFAIEFLEEQNVFDGDRLPTTNVLYVLSAVYEHLPDALDELGNARGLLRRYVWCAFLTRRYENSASTKSLQDYRGLVRVIRDREDPSVVPIFNDDENPLPTADEIRRARWPKTRDILARGILAASLQAGAIDLADGTTITKTNIRKREYHHLFPDSLLTKDGRLPSGDSFRALNCALITWNTNRVISAKEPLAYLKERATKSNLGEGEIRSRLQSHVIPFQELNVGGYEDIEDSDLRAATIQQDYGRFLDKRTEMIVQVVENLCRGT